MAEHRTGDTRRTDRKPALVDTADEPQYDPQGDKQKPGYVSEPLTSWAPDYKGPTGDTQRTSKEPALVEHTSPETSDKTPNEIVEERSKKKDKAVDGSPRNKSVPSTHELKEK